MKQGMFTSISLVLALFVCVSLSAQPSMRSLETINIDTFDETTLTVDPIVTGQQTPSASPVTGKWKVGFDLSRAQKGVGMVTENGFPKLGNVEGIPNSLRALRRPDDPPAKVLGVEVAFARKGDNWFEIYPVPADDSPGTNGRENLEIPLKGTVRQIDFWVWGANYRYVLEVLVRDADGRVHILPAGNLSFYGWRNVVVNIPSWIIQRSRLRSGPESMNFVGFRVRSEPTEYVDNFVVYFDNLKYTTSVLSNIYDGYELRKFDFAADSQEAR
jgi:hypothetical protein